MSTAPVTITLRIPRLGVLFSAEPFDPAQPEMWSVGVLDALVGTWEAHGSCPVTHLRVLLAEKTDDDPTFCTRAKNAVRIFCNRRADENLIAATALRASGWRSMRRGLVALMIALSLSAAIEHWQPLSPLFNRMLSEGLHIIGWVTLWHPVELLLYECAPHKRAARIYDQLTRLHLEFGHEPSATSP